MKPERDPLYDIFEQHLFNALVENESTEQFLSHVVSEYLHEFISRSTVPPGHLTFLEDDLREEVLEMLRKKTYGHVSLQHYRDTHAEKTNAAVPKGSAAHVSKLNSISEPKKPRKLS